MTRSQHTKTATCRWCTKLFTTDIHHQKYCGIDCSKQGTRQKQRAWAERARHAPLPLKARNGAITWRTCLQCSRLFLSEGPWNRICPRCKGAGSRLASPNDPYRGKVHMKGESQ